MDTPRQASHVGWYWPGPRPGDRGNSAINGHLDDRDGHPAVFWRLQEIVPGDDIFVLDSTGKEMHFRAESQEVYPVGKPPLDRLFGPTTEPKLNLLTCSGPWNNTLNRYSEQRVVYARLVSDVP